MKNLLNFFLKYNYWFLFVLLEIISFALLFRFNSYQGSAFFTSANFVSGAMYDAANNVTGYFHLKTINDELVQKNVELELQLESIRKALIEATEDSSGVEQLKQEALAGYDIFKASVINNSVTHADNYITLDKGEADGIRSEMGVVNGSGVVGIVYLTSPHYSIVIPVLNSKSSISCKIKRSDYFGFLKWDGGSSEFAFIKDMPRHSLFSLGDTIVTSGHSAVFPSGIPVGTVDDIADSHDGMLFVLSSAGIFVVDEKKLLSGDDVEYRLLNNQSGLQNAITPNSWNYLDKNNNLYISTEDGVIVINLENYSSNIRSYRIQMKSIQVDDELIRVRRGEDIYINSGAHVLEMFPEIVNYSVNVPYVSIYLEGYDSEPRVLTGAATAGRDRKSVV